MRTIRSIRAATTAAIALSALAGAPAAHAGGWTPELTPLPGVSGSTPPAVAITEGGIVVAGAALPDSGVVVATRAPSGDVTTETIPTSHAASGVQVAVDDAGDVAVSWGEYQASFVAERRTGGTFDTPQQVATGSPVQLAVTDAGEVLAAWDLQEPQGNSLQERIRYGAAPFGAPLRVDGESQPTDSNYDGWKLVAARHSGKAALAWQRRGSDAGGVQTPASIEVVTRDPGGSWSAPQLVSAPLGSDGIAPAGLAIDDAGAIAAAWSEDRTGSSVVELARTGAGGGAFEAPQQVSPTADDSSYPSVAMDAHGGLAMTWGVTRQLDMTHQQFLSADVRLGAPGDPTPVDAPEYGDMLANRWSAPELLLGGARLSDVAADKGDASGADGGHDVASAWAQHDGSPAYDLHLRIWDATPPSIDQVYGPAEVALGAEVSYSLNASDSLSDVTRFRWSIRADGAAVDERDIDGRTISYNFPRSGGYTLTAVVTDAAGNASAVTRRVTVGPLGAVAPLTRAPKVTCHVPALLKHSVAYARRMLSRAHCALGRVATPRRYRHVKGLVIRAQSRRAGAKPVKGAHVNLTLGPKPKPKKHSKSKAKH